MGSINLIRRGGQANHESLEDNLLDLSSQCLIALIMLAEEASEGKA